MGRRRLTTILLSSAGVAAGCYCGIKSGNESFYKYFVMPSVRLMDAETAHKAAVQMARWKLVPSGTIAVADQNVLHTSVWGIDFKSPVGLAAGFDKHAECMDGMLQMGFAFVEVGSITPKEQPGNPQPRVFRLLEDNAVINRYGFNSRGVEYARNNLLQRQNDPNRVPGIIAVNVGKNKETVNAADDYVIGVEKLAEFADYLVVNVSSPNTPGLRKMQGREQLAGLLKRVLQALEKCPDNKRPPLVVKIAPDLTQCDKEDIAAVVLDPETKVDGLIISNTTIARPDYLTSSNKNEIGGLSGAPVKKAATGVIRDMYTLTKGQLPLIGVGGIASGEDAYEKIRAGASLVQLYTSLALEGPTVVHRVNTELAALLKRDGFESVAEAVAADVKL